jgi:amino-acid N-acetyltransferase
VERDWPRIEALLSNAALPLDGARESLEHFLVAEADDGEVVACAAIEPYGSAALLRSVAVREDLRGSGTGAALIKAMLGSARSSTIILLTTTAAEWFRRFGFRQIERTDVPEEVSQSVEFRGACPSSAVIMRLERSGS